MRNSDNGNNRYMPLKIIATLILIVWVVFILIIISVFDHLGVNVRDDK